MYLENRKVLAGVEFPNSTEEKRKMYAEAYHDSRQGAYGKGHNRLESDGSASASAVERVRRRLDQTTQAALAKVAGITEPHMSYILSGQRGASLKTATAISRALGVTVEQFFMYIEYQQKHGRGRRDIR